MCTYIRTAGIRTLFFFFFPAVFSLDHKAEDFVIWRLARLNCSIPRYLEVGLSVDAAKERSPPRPRHFLVLRSCHMSISAVTIHTYDFIFRLCQPPPPDLCREYTGALLCKVLQMTARTFPIRNSQYPGLFLFILERREWRKKSNVPHVSAVACWPILGIYGRCTVACHDTSLTCADRKVLDNLDLYFVRAGLQISHVRCVWWWLQSIIFTGNVGFIIR